MGESYVCDTINLVLELPRELFDRILAHARAELPNEACGVVAGVDGKAVRVYPMRNAEGSPVVYRFDDTEQLKVFKEVEARGWELLGFFHSHPKTKAYPSRTDREIAHWRDPVTGEEVPAHPGTRYLIVSLAEREPVLRAFRFEGGKAVEEEMRIT